MDKCLELEGRYSVDTRRQLIVFTAFLMTNVVLAILALALGLQGQPLGEPGAPSSVPSFPAWLLALGSGGVALVVYGFLGLAGLWFARRLSLPGVFKEDAGWRNWVIIPMALGMTVGVVMVLFDRLAALTGDWGGFEHPPFPLSLIASGTAGIGEEIMFRMFVLGLWAFLLNLVLKRWEAKNVALWVGNLLAALASGAGHLPATMMLLNVSTPADIPTPVLAEVFVLNGLVGLVAGERYIRYGLVAAVGVHFWADIVWHVLYGIL